MNQFKLIAIAIIPSIIALIATLAGIKPASALGDDYIESTTTTAVPSTTTMVALTTTTIPTTTTVPPPEYDASASADAFCTDDGNVIVLVTFRGEALDEGGTLLVMLDDLDVAELVYGPGEVIIEDGELNLNQPATNGGIVTFVMNTSFGSFQFAAEWPAVAVCPMTSSTSIVANPQTTYVSTPVVTEKPLRFAG